MIYASIVTFENNQTILKAAIDSALLCKDAHLIIVDNSISENIKHFIESLQNPRIEFIRPGVNLGFGKGHNIALQKSIERNIRYHVVLNPDVYFSEGVFEVLCRYMDQHETAGLCMPKILDPDGELQYLCKQHPKPFDLFARRFLPNFIKVIFKKKLERFEMRDHDYNTSFDVPYLSGCFMFLRVSTLKEVGLFDERYFMYLEDSDLCRSISSRYRNVYLPEATIYHHHAKGSYKNKKLLKYHLESALKYFNKWGWWPLF